MCSTHPGRAREHAPRTTPRSPGRIRGPHHTPTTPEEGPNRGVESYRDLHAAWPADNHASGDEHGVWLSLLYELDDKLAIDYPDRDNRPGSCTDAVFFHHVTSGRFASGNLVETVPADGGAAAILVPGDRTT